MLGASGGGGGHIFYRHMGGQNSVFIKKCLSFWGAEGVRASPPPPSPDRITDTFSVSILSD